MHWIRLKTCLFMCVIEDIEYVLAELILKLLAIKYLYFWSFNNLTYYSCTPAIVNDSTLKKTPNIFVLLFCIQANLQYYIFHHHNAFFEM